MNFAPTQATLALEQESWGSGSFLWLMSATHCDNDQETNCSSEKRLGKSKEKGAYSYSCSEMFLKKRITYKEIQTISHEGKKKLKKFKRQSKSIQIRIIYAQISGETLLYHN